MQKTARKINSKRRERVRLETIHFAQISTKAKIHPLAKKFCKERRVIIRATCQNSSSFEPKISRRRFPPKLGPRNFFCRRTETIFYLVGLSRDFLIRFVSAWNYFWQSFSFSRHNELERGLKEISATRNLALSRLLKSWRNFYSSKNLSSSKSRA